MSHQQAINKHNLLIANHIYTDDILADMGLSAKKVSPSGTLTEMCETYNITKDNQMLFLRKEAWGWRFRKLYGIDKRSSNGYTWTTLKKMSYHLGYHDYRWSGGKYHKSRRQKPNISCCFTGSSEEYKPFLEAFIELYDFVSEFTAEYMDIQDEIAEQKAKAEAKAKLQAKHQPQPQAA